MLDTGMSRTNLVYRIIGEGQTLDVRKKNPCNYDNTRSI